MKNWFRRMVDRDQPKPDANPPRPGGPREWMIGYFEKNQESFERRIRQSVVETVDWKNPNTLVGEICLGEIQAAIYCSAAGNHEFARSFLESGGEVLTHARSLVGNDVAVDEVDLTRVLMSLAWKVGAILDGSIFCSSWPVPFDGFLRNITTSSALPVEQNTARFIWSMYALAEGNSDQFEKAVSLRLPAHRDLERENNLIGSLQELLGNKDHPGWREYEQVLARWLNPVLETESHASNPRFEISLLLSLLWMKGYLKAEGRQTLLQTLYGETVGCPVPVKRG